MSVAGVWTLYQYLINPTIITATLPNVPSWTIITLTLMSALNLIAIGLLWSWKKIGFYLIIISAVVVASINGTILGIVGLFSSFGALIGLGILYLAMKPVWKSFK